MSRYSDILYMIIGGKRLPLTLIETILWYKIKEKLLFDNFGFSLTNRLRQIMFAFWSFEADAVTEFIMWQAAEQTK